MRRIARSFLLGGALCCLVGGCKERSDPATPAANTPARYGSPTGVASTAIPRVKPVGASADDSWKNAPFYCIQTELSPATLYHSTGKALSLFTHLADVGLGAPTFAVFNGAGGPRPVKVGTPIDPEVMQECWVMVWFAGAKGWTNWDSPWVVCLQRQPRTMKLDESGLHFEFAKEAGYVALLPLYGSYKPPQKGAELLSKHGLPEKGIKTWEWETRIPKEVFHRVRYWAAALREFPVYCEDSFSVDRARDTVTIRSKFQWISIDDDWHTKHLKLAPISPPLALAWKERFPVEFSARVYDMEMFTPYGPYMGVQDVDSFDATLKVLQYVNATEAVVEIGGQRSEVRGQSLQTSVATNETVALAALEKLRQTARSKFRRADKYDYDHGGLDNFCWAIQGDQWYAKALPYMDDATRSNAVASLRKYFREDVLVTNRFKLREYPKGSGRDYYILEGPGIGSWGVLGDAGKFSTDMLETLWAYAHFTGDWDLIKERWPLVKKLFTTPAETRWVGFGRDAIAELGDEAAPCLAFARMAYKVGDMDSYNYGCQMFARELVHHWIKQRGAAYFRQHQPWHSMEWMDEEVYLTNLWGDTAGWQIDGPNYPKQTGERQFQNRWVRFKDADMGRFYRDYLGADVKRELDLPQSRWDEKRRRVNDSHIMPSLVQLRSLLLNETPELLAQVATPEKFGGPPSGVLASCLSVLRTAQPQRLERLIPGGEPSPFVAGLEREVGGPSPCLVQSVQWELRDKQTKTSTPIWPNVAWWGWKTPSGARRSFGQVEPESPRNPASAKAVPLNWNTQVLVYETE